jgi:hypothetical protein
MEKLMSNQINKAARKTLALTYRDGLVDLLLGAFFTLLAIQEPLEQQGLPVWLSYLPSLGIMAIGVVIYAIVKRKVIAPRIGVAKISMRHNPPRRTLLLLAVGLQLITLVIFILASNGWLNENIPAQAGWVIDAFFGIAIFGFFALMGYVAGAPRFYLYGLLLALTTFDKGIWQPGNVWLENLPTLAAGMAMVIGGSVSLVSFIREYPRVDMEAANG